MSTTNREDAEAYFDATSLDERSALSAEGPRETFVQGWLARSALSRPAPATEAKCEEVVRCLMCGKPFGTGGLCAMSFKHHWPSGFDPLRKPTTPTRPATPRAGASEGEALSRLRDRWERIVASAKDGTARIEVEVAGTYDPFARAINAILALRPTPPPAEGVEAKRREFYEACRRYEDAVACVDAFPDDEEVDALNDAKDARFAAGNAKSDAYSALLAAERAERGGSVP